MSFEQHIQQWVSIDNQMKQLSDKMKELRDKKNTLNDFIFNHVDNSNLSNTSVQISDGKIKFIKTKDTQQLTFKYLEICLSEIIKNEDQSTTDICIKKAESEFDKKKLLQIARNINFLNHYLYYS